MASDRANVWLSQHVMPKGLRADESIELANTSSGPSGVLGVDEAGVRTFIPWTSIRFVDYPSDD